MRICRRVSVVLLSLIVIGFSVMGIGMGLQTNKKEYKFDVLINIIKADEERELSKAELESFKFDINSELTNLNSKNELKRAYYALGAIYNLEGNYNKSIELLLRANQYDNTSSDIVDLMIDSGLSNNYMLLGEEKKSEEYFNEAKQLAKQKNMNNTLVDIYYARARGILLSNGKLEEAIKLMEEATTLDQSYEKRIKSYLFLSTMYRLSGEETVSLDYTEEALSIALDHNDEKRINECIINLGENYYVKRQYNRVIYIYESLLDSGRIHDPSNKLIVYGYLVESCFEVGEKDKVDLYKNKYLEELKYIDKDDRNKELIWIYMVLADINMQDKNLKEGEEYFNKANELYLEDKDHAYANTDLNLKNIKIGLDYLKDKNFEKAIERYKSLLKEIEGRGINSDIFYSVIYSMSKLSYENKMYEEFSKQIANAHKIYQNNNETSKTDSAFIKLNNEIFNKNKQEDKKKIYLLTFSLLISMGIIGVVHLKNKKIKKLNKELEISVVTDGLTKVYNKSYLYKIFERLSEKREVVTFIMIDIDYFKKYNDNYGHLKGDEALISVANIIKSTFKDDMTFRYGGEEFSVISERSKKEVLDDLEVLRKRISEENIEHKFSDISDRVTLSIGVEALTINSMDDVERLISLSDKKLYESKVLGRDRYTI